MVNKTAIKDFGNTSFRIRFYFALVKQISRNKYLFIEKPTRMFSGRVWQHWFSWQRNPPFVSWSAITLWKIAAPHQLQYEKFMDSGRVANRPLDVQVPGLLGERPFPRSHCKAFRLCFSCHLDRSNNSENLYEMAASWDIVAVWHPKQNILETRGKAL